MGRRGSAELAAGSVRAARLAGRFAGGVRLGRLRVGCRRLGGRGRLAVRREDEVRRGIVAQQAPGGELDMGEAGRVAPASASFAEVDGRLRSAASLSLGGSSLPLQLRRLPVDKRTMPDQRDLSGKRGERAAFETDRLLVVGDVTLPPEGYQSRFSDSLNRAELEFVSLTNCEVTTLTDGTTRRQDFVMLSKRHVRLAYPVGAEPPAAPPAPPRP